MNKRKIWLSAVVVVLVLALLVFAAWKIAGPSLRKPDENYLFVPTGTDYEGLKKIMKTEGLIRSDIWFDWTARMLKFKQVKAGRYEINNGMSLLNLVRMLRNGRHSPVAFVITKLRTKEALASRVGKAFECDSVQMMAFLNNPDSLKTYGLDTNTVMAAAMPLTYSIRWNSDAAAIFGHFSTAYKLFWNESRQEKAAALNLSKEQVITIASIVDEETNAPSDKPQIASVYLNRVRTGMPLQADPTLKFAMKNFALKRVLNVHKETDSPYNTYRNTGLPPGPICTPQASTIDSVLNAPKTEYIYFVASSEAPGTHIFTTNYKDHLKYARIYQKYLDKRNIR